MKKKFLRSCFALLLSMVLLFGGVRWDAAATGDVSPFGPVLPPSAVTFTVSAPRTVMSNEETMQMSYSVSQSGGTITWSSSNTSVATVSSSGVVTAVTGGNATITGRYTYNGSVYTDSVSVEVYTLCNSIGISNSTEYYIMNASSGRLLSLENDSDANFTKAYTCPRSDTTLSQWRTRKLSDGYYNIQSVSSLTGKCLDVTNNNLDIYNDNGAGYLRFTLRRVENGIYEGLYLIQHTNSGLYVTQGSNYYVYVTATPTESSYWSFIKGSKSWAQLYGFQYDRKVNGNNSIYDSIDKFDEVATYLDNMGYMDVANVNLDTFLAYTFLQTDDMFIYAGHGERGRISFCDEDPNQRIITGEIIKGTIIAHDNMNDTKTVFPNHHCINELSYNQLANARCVLYLACLSGKSYTSSYGTYNLIDETFNKGAHFVLGATEKITNAHVDPWMEEFFASAARGNSIEQCIVDADYAIKYITYDTDYGQETCYGLPVYTRGDQKQYLSIGG